MVSTGKESTDPNVGTSSAIRKRGTPGSSSPSKRLAKRRQSMRNRRVSFAPDRELTMVHTFEKDEYNSPNLTPPPAIPKISETEPLPAEQPQVLDMEITQNLSAVHENPKEDANWNLFLKSSPGEITAALPSLTALAEADELDDQHKNTTSKDEDDRDLYPEVRFFQNGPTADYDNITAAVPGLGALLEEDEADGDTVAAAAPIAVPATALNQKHDLDMSMDLSNGTNPNFSITQGEQEQGNQHQDDPLSNSPSDMRQQGQATKWGFVPGDDDTMELDLEGHGRMMMGDRTYAGLYDDASTGGHTGGVIDTPNSVNNTSSRGNNNHVHAVLESSPVEQLQEGGQSGDVEVRGANQPFGLPNWTMPAFLPPYLANTTTATAAIEEQENEGVRADHPALHHSPGFTNSSLNTMSTRRVSVDTRRVSVTSRRASMMTTGVGRSGFAADTENGLMMAVANNGDEDEHIVMKSNDVGNHGEQQKQQNSDLTDDLLADDTDDVAVGDSNNHVLAGVQRQPAFNQTESPAISQVRAATTNKTPFSVGYADSSRHNAHTNTEGLLRTGGTTGLLEDPKSAEEKDDNTMPSAAPALSQGGGPTTRLLRLDATASSAIAARAKALMADDAAHDDDVTAPLVSPTMAGHHKMSNSPPASALTGGSMGRVLPGGASLAMIQHSVHSLRSQSHFTPGTAQGAMQKRATVGLGFTPGTQGPYAAPPGSAIAARYPGSAIAQGRLSQGFAPSLVPAITFQDFAKIVEVQFLDNLRRGSSINYADLAPNPIPATLGEAYTLLCITSPNMAELETAVHTLRSETARLRGSASDVEVMLGANNPPIFRHVQSATMEQLEAFRHNVGLLKKMCRAKAIVLLKDVRCQMEDSKANRLARAAESLQTDLTFVRDHAKHTSGVAAAAEKYAYEMRQRLQIEAANRAVEIERRKRVIASRAALEESRAANAQRMKRLEEASARLAELRRERQELATEKATVAAAVEQIQASLAKLTALKLAGGKDPRIVLAQMKAVSRLSACLGVSIEQTYGSNVASSSVTVCLRVGPIFRLNLSSTPAGYRGTVEVAPLSPDKNSSECSLAAAMAGVNSGDEVFFVDPSGAPAAVQTTIAHLQRCSDLAAELRGVRDQTCRHLCEVSAAATPNTSSSAAGVRLLFSGSHADVRFAVTLVPGRAYPLGHLPMDCKIYFDGDGQVTVSDIESVVSRVPPGPGRIRAICVELSDLVDSTAPKPIGQSEAFKSAFGNPLFGSRAAAVDLVA